MRHRLSESTFYALFEICRLEFMHGNYNEGHHVKHDKYHTFHDR